MFNINRRWHRTVYFLTVLMLIVVGLSISWPHSFLSHPVSAQSPAIRQVDVVFVMDTSGSMDDEFSTLCSEIQALVAGLQAEGVTVNYTIMGIIQTRGCAGSIVQNDLLNATASHEEDWGPAVADVAAYYAWQPGYVRLIIPMSDEAPYQGNPCESPGLDRDAILTAISAANSNNVRVAPVVASQEEPEYAACNEELARLLADSTGGQVFYSSTPGDDLVDGIKLIIGDVAQDRDGDGIADDQDPAPDDACLPDPQRVCYPLQVCGQTNTPHWDDDGDGQTDEELENKQDDDGDGLVDEDVGGVGCPFPKQRCNVNNHRYFDDDNDGQTDEEEANDRDDDGDNFIDEDIECACPAQQTTDTETPGIDDDHDFQIDEESPNGSDDDGDGCIDEDINGGIQIKGRVTDGYGHGLTGVLVELLAGVDPTGMPVEHILPRAPNAAYTLTDSDGRYALEVPSSDQPDQQIRYRIRATLEHYDILTDTVTNEGQPVFAVIYSHERHEPTNQEAQEATFVVTPDFDLTDPNTEQQNIDFGEFEALPTGSYVNLPADRLDILSDLAGTFYRIYQAKEFAYQKLEISSFEHTLQVRAFDSKLNHESALFNSELSAIRMSVAASRWEAKSAPKNVQWHEFGHFVMFEAYGRWPTLPDGTPIPDGYDTHAGYFNAETTGSWLEGWAEFFACAVADHLGEPDPASYPPLSDMPNDFLSAPNLEENYWLSEGPWWDNLLFRPPGPLPDLVEGPPKQNREEFAVAGILWDLYDNPASDDDTIHLELATIWDIIRAYHRRGVYSVKELSIALRSYAKQNGLAQHKFDTIFFLHGAFINPAKFDRPLEPDFIGFSGGYQPHKDHLFRENTPSIPGAAIKIQSQELFGTPVEGITLTVYTEFEPPHEIYNRQRVVQMDDAEALFYFEPPPDHYTSTTRIEAQRVDGTTTEPWLIDNQAYWQTWAQTMDNAGNDLPDHVLEHDFVFPGQPSNNSGAFTGLFLFGILLAGGALAFVLIRKKQPTHAMLWIRQEDSGYSQPLKRSITTIGRATTNDLVLPHTLVSRNHARIIYEDKTYYIEDLDSKSGTFVNHQRVTRSALADGDEIGIGNTLMVFRRRD